jgi:hypothetical protein
MENIIGRKARIKDDKEELKRNGECNFIRMTANKPSDGLEDFAGMVGTVVGYNAGRDYGDMYDSPLIIVQFTLDDGTKKTVRADERFVELVE